MRQHLNPNYFNFIFSALPNIQSHHFDNFYKFDSFFIRNPDIILEKYDSTQNKNINEVKSDTFKPRLRKKKMTEIDRLSYVVRTIDHDKSIVHMRAYKILHISELRRNDLFKGLSYEDLDKKEKYVHLRPVENQVKKDKIAMRRAIFDFKSLDSINEDPINC